MKDVILKDWGWLRLARLIFAFYLIFKAYKTNEIIYYFIGGVLLYQSIFNIKCLTGTCTTDTCNIESKPDVNK